MMKKHKYGYYIIYKMPRQRKKTVINNKNTNTAAKSKKKGKKIQKRRVNKKSRNNSNNKSNNNNNNSRKKKSKHNKRRDKSSSSRSNAQLPRQIKYKSKKCIARTKANKRCGNKTKRSKYCRVHLQSIEHLQIKKSKIPNAGLGLFTTQNIIMPRKKRGRVSTPPKPLIAVYGGKIVDNDPQTPYTVALPNGKFLDGADPTSSAARFANNCRTQDKKICKSNNAQLIKSSSNPPVVKLVATRNIYYEKPKRKQSNKANKGKKSKKRNKNNQPDTQEPNNEIYAAYGRWYRAF